MRASVLLPLTLLATAWANASPECVGQTSDNCQAAQELEAAESVFIQVSTNLLGLQKASSAQRTGKDVKVTGGKSRAKAEPEGHGETAGEHKGKAAEGHGEGHGEEGEEHEEFSQADVGISGMLFGSVAFVMVLFYLVNWNDEDIRRYSWSIISTTMTIFAAVLTFTSVDFFVKAVFQSESLILLVSYFLFFALFLVLQGTTAIGAGIVLETGHVNLEKEVWVVADSMRIDYGCEVREEEVRNKTGVKSVAYIEGREVFVQKKKLDKETRERRLKCWAALFAHMTGFAAINACGALQHMPVFAASPMGALFAVVINQLIILALFRAADLAWKRMATAEHGHGHSHAHGHAHGHEEDPRMEMFEEEIEEAESDVCALSTSFTLLQVIRFALSHTLPHSDGIEHPEVAHSSGCVIGLYVIGLIFAASTAVFLVLRRRVDHHSRAEHVLEFLQNTSAMGFAWSMLWATRWLAVGSAGFQAIASSPATMVGRLLLALLLSVLALVVIFVLDKIDDHAGGGPAVARLVQNLVTALSILVGFSWEHCFDGGVEVLAEVTPSPMAFRAFSVVTVLAVIIPAWRRYILAKVIALNEQHEEKLQAKEAKLGGGHHHEHAAAATHTASAH